ncbi:MAG TPA: LptF/LptG family permease [Candidatus Cloacimonadota bacterium]|nr:LptF/LptG family permease [Candidatus Cloacimonadota bacterium]
MKILPRYILKEHVSPFFVSLLVVTFILLIDRIIDLLNTILEKKLDISTVMQLFGLSLPYMLALSIPMAVLVATILAFGRMTVDREVVALKSSGINVYRMIGPLLVVGIMLSGLMVYFNQTFLPNTNHKLKNLMVKIAYYKPMTIIKAGEFTNVLDYTIYVRQNNVTELKDVLIYDRSETRFPRTVFAKTGSVQQMDNGNSLQITLRNGEMHERNDKEPGKYQVRNFSSFVVNIRNISSNMDMFETGFRSDREMTGKELQTNIKDKKNEIAKLSAELTGLNAKIKSIQAEAPSFYRDSDLRRYKVMQKMSEDRIADLQESKQSLEVEFHKKYALSFAVIIFILIGIPLGLMTRSSGIGMSFSVSSVIFLIYYVALNGGEQLADKGHVSPFLAMWISNIVFFICGLLLIYASIKEKRLIDLPQLMWKIQNWRRKKVEIPDEIRY